MTSVVTISFAERVQKGIHASVKETSKNKKKRVCKIS